MHQFKKGVVGFVLALSLFAVVAPVQAAGLSTSQISAILSLLQSFGADQGVINNVSQALGGQTSPGSQTCVDLTYNLYLGKSNATTNGEVSKLQTFLGVTGTGYFGPRTELAVQNWQSTHTSVTSGSADTNGFGVVGPATRAAMACGTKPVDGITVTAPNGGEQWQAGVLNTVTWTPYQYNPDINPAKDVTAYLEQKDDAGGYHTLGKVEESGKASIHWITGELDARTVGGKVVQPGLYYVRVVNNVTGAWDRSDAPFTVLPKPVDLKINGSDGPMTATAGVPLTATWTATGAVSCRLDNAYDMPNPTVYPIPAFDNMPTSGTRTMYVPQQQNWYVNLGCLMQDGSTLYDSVVVNASSAAASLQITSPNGGQVIDPSQVMTVSFQHAGIKSYSTALYKNDKWLYWIAKDTPINGTNNTQSMSWQTPGAAIAGLGVGDNAGAIFKIYVTGQKADGTGYVDDKSDTPFSFGAASVANGALSISTDASSPSYQVFAGGTSGVTLGVFKIHASGENVNLNKIGLSLNTDTAYSGDLGQVGLYVDGQLIGTAVFLGNTFTATSTLTQSRTIAKDTDLFVVVKGDIAPIGVNKPGRSGDLVKVVVMNAQGNGASTGLNISASQNSNASVAGVRIYKGFPMVSQVAIPAGVFINGIQPLMRFKVAASQSGGPVGIGGFMFNMTNSAGITQLGLYAFTDSSYATPVSGQGTGGQLGMGIASPANPLAFSPNTPLEIQPGQTLYFELRGIAAGVTGQSSVSVTLLGDSNAPASLQSGIVLREKTGGFVWSPNDLTTSQFSDNDWTNGYGVLGLPASGITQTLVGNGSVVPTVTTAPKGFFDTASCSLLRAWAYDADTPSDSIQVHLYKDGPAGQGTFVGAYTANVVRPDVNAALGIAGNHGAEVVPPANAKDGLPHAYYFYGINTDGTSDHNTLLEWSPRTITCSPDVAPVASSTNPRQAVANQILQMAVGSIAKDYRYDLNHNNLVTSADALAYLQGQDPVGTTPIPECTTAVANRGQNNQTFSCACPASFTQGVVWGSGNTYTDDSNICTAAQHESLMVPTGGVLQYMLLPGQSAYTGTTVNGVTTQSWGAWQGSFGFPGAITVTSAAVAPITHTLASGWTGAEVSTLQSALTKLGLLKTGVTGYFGSATKAAVQNFQAANNLAAVGIVGPKTRSLLLQALGF